MADQWTALESILGKLEAADLPILASALMPAVFGEIEHFLPVAYLPLETAIASAIQPAAQAALTSLLSKLPQFPQS